MTFPQATRTSLRPVLVASRTLLIVCLLGAGACIRVGGAWPSGTGLLLLGVGLALLVAMVASAAGIMTSHDEISAYFVGLALTSLVFSPCALLLDDWASTGQGVVVAMAVTGKAHTALLCLHAFLETAQLLPGVSVLCKMAALSGCYLAGLWRCAMDPLQRWAVPLLLAQAVFTTYFTTIVSHLIASLVRMQASVRDGLQLDVHLLRSAFDATCWVELQDVELLSDDDTSWDDTGVMPIARSLAGRAQEGDAFRGVDVRPFFEKQCAVVKGCPELNAMFESDMDGRVLDRSMIIQGYDELFKFFTSTSRAGAHQMGHQMITCRDSHGRTFSCDFHLVIDGRCDKSCKRMLCGFRLITDKSTPALTEPRLLGNPASTFLTEPRLLGKYQDPASTFITRMSSDVQDMLRPSAPLGFRESPPGAVSMQFFCWQLLGMVQGVFSLRCSVPHLEIIECSTKARDTLGVGARAGHSLFSLLANQQTVSTLARATRIHHAMLEEGQTEHAGFLARVVGFLPFATTLGKRIDAHVLAVHLLAEPANNRPAVVIFVVEPRVAPKPRGGLKISRMPLSDHAELQSAPVGRKVCWDEVPAVAEIGTMEVLPSFVACDELFPATHRASVSAERPDPASPGSR